jgi:hypothetical protein
MRTHVFLISLAVAMSAGLASAQPTAPATELRQAPSRQAASEFDSRGWRLLGERAVQGRRDRDRITIGAYEGRFDQLVLVVADGNIQLSKLALTFGNGERFNPEVRHLFQEGARTRVIDLPGNNRVIRRIDLAYGRFGRGKAIVQVWGRDTRAGDPGGAPTWNSRGWDRLGQAQVMGTFDRDVIKVGRDDGRFTKLGFVVEDSDVELYDVIVTFGNGESFAPNVRHTFREGARSQEIDLPGATRAIKQIDFRYGNLPGGGRATVVVYGLPEKAAAEWDNRGWTLLGERQVAGKADLDRIVVGKDNRTSQQLTLVVLDSALELNDIVVFFGNGQTFNPKLKTLFTEGARSRVIDLPKDRRTIEKVEMSYGNLPGGGRARLQIWAK